MNGFLSNFLSSSLALAVIAFLGREWISARLRIALEKEQKTVLAAAEIKRQACLEALQVADAALANLKWQCHGKNLTVDWQLLNIDKARDCYNKLALTCESDETLRAYIRVLNLRCPGEPTQLINGDTINELRNAMRKELGFGKGFDLPAEKAWIASLERAENTSVAIHDQERETNRASAADILTSATHAMT